MTTRSGVEPEVAEAVADLGGPGRSEAPSRLEPHEPQPFEPVARDAAPEPPRDAHGAVATRAARAPAPAEPPKRRSTVREPAPMFSSGAMSDVQPLRRLPAAGRSAA